MLSFLIIDIVLLYVVFACMFNLSNEQGLKKLKC